jgi:hypothetical protein
MRCWFHNWTRWCDPISRWKDELPTHQQRTCTKCNKVEERKI